MSFVHLWVAPMMRIVPDFDRITRLCVRGTVAPVANALEQLAVGDAGGREVHVVAADEIVDGEHLVEVVPEVERGAALVVVAGPRADLESCRRGT